jgi:hypothetical protein
VYNRYNGPAAPTVILSYNKHRAPRCSILNFRVAIWFRAQTSDQSVFHGSATLLPVYQPATVLVGQICHFIRLQRWAEASSRGHTFFALAALTQFRSSWSPNPVTDMWHDKQATDELVEREKKGRVGNWSNKSHHSNICKHQVLKILNLWNRISLLTTSNRKNKSNAPLSLFWTASQPCNTWNQYTATIYI